ncbi:MAG: cytochrome c oxidase accessory protein CcoG [Wenzhouxiangellaceae bacterium]
MSQSSNETASLYQAHEKIYPREISGRFSKLRNLAAWILLGLFYTVAWIRIDGQQLVLFDLPARKFYVFGLTFWPQDFLLLTVLLIIAALSLFFFTALAGRLWCGYACPQTVWTEVFVALERFTEGNRMQRMKLDQGPWDRNKLWRKSAKQFLWITFSLWTGFTFVGYFTPIHELGAKVLALETGPWETFWLLFYGFATYGNAGFLREQVCKYMCPYARFQSAMFDRDTLVIAYDPERGEPRGKRKRKADLETLGLGDCIDCTWCVQVCPTGIDIRDGLQYECIACGACVDACDQIMDKMNYPRGLIKYTTQNTIDHQPSRIMRPRIYIYIVLLLALISAFIFGVGGRDPLIVDVIRDRNALYRVASDGAVENAYTLRLINKTDVPQEYRIAIEEAGYDLRTWPEIAVAAGAVQGVPVTVRRIAGQANDAQAVAGYSSAGQIIHFVISTQAEEQPPVVESSRFFGPESQP